MAAVIEKGTGERCNAYQSRDIVKARSLTPPHNPTLDRLASTIAGIRRLSAIEVAGRFTVPRPTARTLVALAQAGKKWEGHGI